MKPVSDVHELFRRQRAIRSFTDEDVPDALVDQVLTAAIHGPSGSNTQPWHGPTPIATGRLLRAGRVSRSRPRPC